MEISFIATAPCGFIRYREEGTSIPHSSTELVSASGPDLGLIWDEPAGSTDHRAGTESWARADVVSHHSAQTQPKTRPLRSDEVLYLVVMMQRAALALVSANVMSRLGEKRFRARFDWKVMVFASSFIQGLSSLACAFRMVSSQPSAYVCPPTKTSQSTPTGPNVFPTPWCNTASLIAALQSEEAIRSSSALVIKN